MKTYHIKHMTAASFAVLGLCLGSVGVSRAQNQPTQTQTHLEMLTPQTESFTLSKIAGKPVRGANQEQFSTITDFLIEPQSGRVHFVVSPSGSNTFRIIPMAALQAGSTNEGINLNLDRAQWQKVGTMIEQRLGDRVTINDDHQRRVAQEFGLGNAEGTVGGLVRASSLKGREVRSGNDRLGTIEDVVIDFHNKIAAPVLNASGGGFAAAEQKFLVPFHRLQLGDGNAPINTNLSQNDFRQLSWQSGPTPTGYSSGQFQQAFQPTASAAMAIQQSLEQNQSVPRGSVQVVPESRIVLRGTVDSEQKKQEIERQAQQAAPGVRVDSQITVRNW